jgi:hypothetical protein
LDALAISEVYAYAASRIDRAAPIISVGLAGKILGPVGWLIVVNSGEWPLRTFTLIVFNDLIWWLPFGLFLLDKTRTGKWLRRITPWACAAIIALAALVMPACRQHLVTIAPQNGCAQNSPMRRRQKK